MVNSAYKKYMRSKAWALKRQQVFARYGKRCYACGTFKGPIQVHHLTYVRFGHENLSDLRPLCAKCHREVTRLHWQMGKRRTPGEIVFREFMKIKRATALKRR